MKLLNYTAVLLSSSLLAACGGQAQPSAASKAAPADRVATINGKPLSRGEFETYLANIERQSGRRVTLDQRAQLLDQFVGIHLAAAAAEKRGLEKDPKVSQELAIARTNVLSEAALQRYLDEHPVTNEELKPAYDESISKLPPEYKTRHILVDNPGTAAELIEKINKGADFAKLAKQKSTDSSKDTGGDIGWVVPQDMVEEYAKAVFALKLGETTQEPVKTRFGWHVIRLDEVRSQQVGAFDGVKDKVALMLKRERLDSYLEGLRKEAKIEMDPRGPAPQGPQTLSPQSPQSPH